MLCIALKACIQEDITQLEIFQFHARTIVRRNPRADLSRLSDYTILETEALCSRMMPFKAIRC
jgi:hypothetical protein